jgi:hypothetical protein
MQMCVFPGITMVGTFPRFYKVTVTADLDLSIRQGQYPHTETVVHRHTPRVPRRRSEGMRPLMNRKHVLRCFEAFKRFVFPEEGWILLPSLSCSMTDHYQQRMSPMALTSLLEQMALPGLLRQMKLTGAMELREPPRLTAQVQLGTPETGCFSPSEWFPSSQLYSIIPPIIKPTLIIFALGGFINISVTLGS